MNETNGRDEVFWKIGHDPDDEQLREAVSKVENPNKADNGGMTYLHAAATNRKVGAAEALLKKGADPNCVDNRGNTPLSNAIGRKHPDNAKIVQLLLDYGADLDAKCGGSTIRETIKMFNDPDLMRFVE